MKSRILNSLKYLLLWVFLASLYHHEANASAPLLMPPVIGGFKVHRREKRWKSTVYLHFTQPKPAYKVCGGILVSRRWLITAAHCVFQIYNTTQYLSVGVGRVERSAFPGTHNFSVSNIIIHENYYSLTGKKLCLSYDIALVKLSRNIPGSVNLLPLAGSEEDISSTNARCEMAGWGSVEELTDRSEYTTHKYKVSPILMKTYMKLLTKEECTKREDSKNKYYFNCENTENLETIICGDMSKPNNPTGCLGDSGSPLICRLHWREKIYGLVIGGSQTCKPQNGSMLFTDVSKLSTWIRETMARGYALKPTPAPKPSTLAPKPSTLAPKPSTLAPKSSTPAPKTMKPEAQISEKARKPIVYFKFTQSNSEFNACGGIMISNQWVMTAAHCLTRIQDHPEYLSVRDEAPQEQKTSGISNYNISKIAIHPNYSSQDINNTACTDNDIALVKLDQPIDYKLTLISLPNGDEDISNDKGLTCRVSGWSSPQQESNTTQESQVSPDKTDTNATLITKQECINIYNEKQKGESKCLKDANLERSICANVQSMGALSDCRDNSGSPLICQVNGEESIQGIILTSSKVCENQNLPIRFTEVSMHVEWIKDTLAEG